LQPAVFAVNVKPNHSRKKLSQGLGKIYPSLELTAANVNLSTFDESPLLEATYETIQDMDGA